MNLIFAGSTACAPSVGKFVTVELGTASRGPDSSFALGILGQNIVLNAHFLFAIAKLKQPCIFI